MSDPNDFLEQNARARAVFQHIVENFVQDGAPIGSRTLSKNFEFSPATLRNVMADLEDLGLLMAPHISAGRIPTDQGLRYFVDGVLETGTLSDIERRALEEECSTTNTSAEDLLENASTILSSLSASAGLVVAPQQKTNRLKQIQFVQIEPTRAMVILVSEGNNVENRVIELPQGITPAILQEASNFLSEKFIGRTIEEMNVSLIDEIKHREHELNALTSKVIESGLARKLEDGKLIVHGRSQLLKSPQAVQDIERIQELMEQLESKDTVAKLLDEASAGQGVKIYIGSENSIFKGSGHSLILSPYADGNDNVIGAIGVIGPTRLNYAKIIPAVNYMAEIISRKLLNMT